MCVCVCVCSALQIFQKEYHPSVYKSGLSGVKEGLSLFGPSSLCLLLELKAFVQSVYFLVPYRNCEQDPFFSWLQTAQVRIPFCHSSRFTFSHSRRLWFLRPLADMSVLRERQEAVEFLKSPTHDETTTMLYDCIKHIKNIPVSPPSVSFSLSMAVDTSIYGLHQRILSKINIAQASMNDWQSLYKVINTVVYASLLHLS